jgi:hypothetical protein
VITPTTMAIPMLAKYGTSHHGDTRAFRIDRPVTLRSC